MGLMAGKASRPTPLLHVRLEDVPLALLKVLANPPLVLPKSRPVVVVELLDDLEGPATLEDVAPDHVRTQPLGGVAVAGLLQRIARVTQQQVGVSHQLVEGVEVTTRALHEFKRFGKFSDGVDGGLVDPRATLARLDGFTCHSV